MKKFLSNNISTRNFKAFSASFLFFVSLLFVLNACKKEENTVGMDIQPDSDKFTISDTMISVVGYAMIDDSIKTSGTSVSLLGDIVDPVFGRTKAGIYTQFRLPADNISFGAEAELDSLVLTLAYNGFYGDTANAFILKVFEITEDMNAKTTYYNSSVLQCGSENLTEKSNHTLTPRPNTSIKIDTVNQVPHIRISLSKSFGTSKFLDTTKNSHLATNAAFLSYFKGLYITAEKVNDGSLVYIDMINSMTALTVYYHNKEKKNANFSFVTNESSAYFTNIDHFGYADASSSLKKQIIDMDYSNAGQEMYMQASGGVKTILSFPQIDSLFKDKKVVINKAELIITPTESNKKYALPEALVMYYKKDNSAGSTSYFVVDQLTMGDSYFGGTYNSSKKEYRFRITKYLQQLITEGTETYPLHLAVSGSMKGNRMVFYGPEASEQAKRLRVEITYSLIQ